MRRRFVTFGPAYYLCGLATSTMLVVSVVTLIPLVINSLLLVASAQEPVTFVLRSGETIAVGLIDFSLPGFSVRQNGVRRHIPFDEVIAVDFNGEGIPDSEWSLVPDGGHALSLRTGTVLQGRLHDVGGTHPLRITFERDGERRLYASSEIARILLARPANRPTLGALIDLNGLYLAPSTGRSIADGVTSVTTHRRGDRRGEGQVYERHLGMPAREGTFTPFSDELTRPNLLDGVDLRGQRFQCDVDLDNRDLWQVDAEFFQIGLGRQADPGDSRTEEVFVFIYRLDRAFALYMETDWSEYRAPTTYYAAPDETTFRIRVEVNTAGTEALLTVVPLNGSRAHTPHTVKPLSLDLLNDNVRNASFFAGFTHNYSDVKSNARVRLSNCAVEGEI
jgi:hypothetical protein